MESFSLKETEYLQLTRWQLEEKRLTAGFTTKNGGVSDGVYSSNNCGLHVGDKDENVIDNRKSLASLLNYPLNTWVIGEQVHGTEVQLVTKADRGSGTDQLATALKGIDGLVTKEKDILLIAFFADCIPLYFFDPVKEIIGLAHAGWKGTVHGIAAHMIQKMKEAGAQLEDIQVSIGPGISKQYYEVDDRIVLATDSTFHEKVFTKKENGRYLFDLKKLNSEILLQNGILRHNIDITQYCTYKDEAFFFSHRRDNGSTGRMLGFIGLRA